MSTVSTAIPPLHTETSVEMPLCVTSETAPLEQVIVHTPGPELEHLAPGTRVELLFDDLLFVEQARREHLLMCALFEKVTGHSDAVLQITDLLRETFDQAEARHDFAEKLCSATPASNLQAFVSEIRNLGPDELLDFVLTGRSELPLNVPPLPNLMFTRDLAAVVGDHVIVSHAATAARARESILIDVILHYHPSFADHRSRIIELPRGVTFEGGDLLVASPEVVLIGHSQRTSMSGIMAVAEALFEKTSVRHVVAVDLPRRRFCMHLDTVFTFCSPSECVVFPPLIEADGAGCIFHLQPGSTPGEVRCTMHPRLKGLLEELLGHSMTFIPCGGWDRLSQEREQWTDGANFFALAPGIVVGYERNGHTFELMRQHDYRVVSVRHALSLLNEDALLDVDEKLAIKLEGTELSRGRGGPRCMTLPLRRKEFQQS